MKIQMTQLSTSTLNAPCTDESVRLPGGVKAVSKPFVLIYSFVRVYQAIRACVFNDLCV